MIRNRSAGDLAQRAFVLRGHVTRTSPTANLLNKRNDLIGLAASAAAFGADASYRLRTPLAAVRRLMLTGATLPVFTLLRPRATTARRRRPGG